jgi:hypothetical protein
MSFQKTVFHALLAAALVFVGAQAQASLIRITPEGVAVDEQVQLDPVPISADGFRLSYWGGGKSTILDPLVLVFATPDGVTPTLVSSGTSNPTALTADITLGGTNVYGGSWDTTTGSAGTYDSTDSGSVYADIGLTGAGGSQNYSNWNGESGITSWDLWVYTITFDPDLSQGDWMEFSTTNLALGSFVVGYGCTKLSDDSIGTACWNAGTTEDTPFTFAGYVTTTKVPEPGTLALLGLGLFAIGLTRRRRQSI